MMTLAVSWLSHNETWADRKNMIFDEIYKNLYTLGTLRKFPPSLRGEKGQQSPLPPPGGVFKVL